jgi:hypothetical protein
VHPEEGYPGCVHDRRRVAILTREGPEAHENALMRLGVTPRIPDLLPDELPAAEDVEEVAVLRRAAG